MDHTDTQAVRALGTKSSADIIGDRTGRTEVTPSSDRPAVLLHGVLARLLEI